MSKQFSEDEEFLRKNFKGNSGYQKAINRYNREFKLYNDLANNTSHDVHPPIESELRQLFRPLLDSGRLSEQGLRALADVHSDFYNKVPTYDGTRRTLPNRGTVPKTLGRFTIDALNTLPHDQFPKMIVGDFPRYRGRMDANTGNNMLLNINPNLDPLSTIVHEGRHGIEHAKPIVPDIIYNFATKIANRTASDDKRIPAGYLPRVFDDIRTIIGNVPGFDKYKLKGSSQLHGFNIGENQSKNEIAETFDEAVAYALENRLMKGTPFTINQDTNDDSRKLLRNLMKGTHQRYRELGIDDQEKYPGLDQAFEELIKNLQRNKSQNKETIKQQAQDNFRNLLAQPIEQSAIDFGLRVPTSNIGLGQRLPLPSSQGQSNPQQFAGAFKGFGTGFQQGLQPPTTGGIFGAEIQGGSLFGPRNQGVQQSITGGLKNPPQFGASSFGNPIQGSIVDHHTASNPLLGQNLISNLKKEDTPKKPSLSKHKKEYLAQHEDEDIDPTKKLKTDEQTIKDNPSDQARFASGGMVRAPQLNRNNNRDDIFNEIKSYLYQRSLEPRLDYGLAPYEDSPYSSSPPHPPLTQLLRQGKSAEYLEPLRNDVSPYPSFTQRIKQLNRKKDEAIIYSPYPSLARVLKKAQARSNTQVKFNETKKNDASTRIGYVTGNAFGSLGGKAFGGGIKKHSSLKNK